MSKETKLKSISLSKLKIAEPVEGQERRVTFVASSSNEDRDYETLDIGSFRLPKKGGGYITVRDLPAGGSENVVIPFLTDHDLWAVEKTIGSVRRAEFVDGELIFEAGISSRDYAQDVFKLIEEGHLDNAFSIQFRDYEWNADAKTISNGEIVEVSLVTRGSNKEAQVLEVKQMKGEDMPTEATSPNPVDEQAQTQTEAALATSDNTQTADPANNQTEPTTTNPSEGSKEKGMYDLPDHKQVIASQVKMPSQVATSAGRSKQTDYLKSKAAVKDYARISRGCPGDSGSVKEAWGEYLKGKGITISDGSSFLPTQFEQVMFKGWHDDVGILSTFRRTRAKMSKFYAMTTGDRALGHKKGEQKKDQDVVAIPRVTALHTMYKKLPIDYIDIINDDSGELYTFRGRELYDRLLSTMGRNAIVGDGLSAPAEGAADYRGFVDGEGLYPIADDINNSNTADSYASVVATLVANEEGDDMYDKIIKTLAAVFVEKNSRRKKVLVVPAGTLTTFLLQKNENGGRLYPVGTNFEELFNVSQIIELDQADMTRVGLDVIAYAEDGYTFGGPDADVRNWYDGDVNKDQMLVEQAVQGSLEGYKVAAGYASK